MPIRRLNYTNRKKLTRDQVRIRLLPGANGDPRPFEADLHLPPDLPGEARVFVEAYRSSPAARMRFDFGSVHAIKPPPLEQRRLAEFHDDHRPPLFRVKVTDVTHEPGRLLADAHQIRPLDPDEQPDQRQGILYVAWRDLDGPVWAMDLEDERGPQLLIDAKADPHHDLPDRTEFKALVYPEVIRRVMTWILIDQKGESIEDPESWHALWVRFPQRSFGFSEEPPAADADDEDKRAWIDDAVRWCSRQAGFCEAIAPREEES
jgi:hypothetical protein